MLSAAALLTLRPWDSDSDSTALQLPDPPQLEAGLGDATAVAPGGGPALAGARVAPAGLAVPVIDPAAVPAPMTIPQLAVSPARPVAVSRSVDVPSSPVGTAPPAAPTAPAPAPAPAPQSPPAPPPASLPVSAPPAVSPPPASSAGGGAEEEEEGEEEAAPLVEACEGEEYAIFVSFDAETMEPLEVLIRHLDEEGEESEVRFEGEALDEALELVDLLVAVEGCEWTEVEPASP